MDQRADLRRQLALGRALLGVLDRRAVELDDRLVGEKGEEPQVGTDHLVLRAKEELVQLVGTRPACVQPHRPRLGLAELRAVGLHHEGGGQAEGLGLAHLADEFDPHRDVPPLVAPPELEPAVEGVVEMEVVVGLEEHVAELGVGDPLVGSLQPRTDRVLRGHLPDGEVLAHVAEELEQTERPQPVRVVDEQRRRSILATLEVEEPPQLVVDALAVRAQLVGRQQRPLLRFAPRIADEPGPASCQRDGTVAGQLEAAEIAQLEEMPHVEAVGRRVEPAVRRQRSGVEAAGQRGIGHLMDEAAEAEVLDEVNHGLSLPRGRTDVGRYDRRPPVASPRPATRTHMRNPYLHGNFAPVLEERSDDHPLPLTGAIPPDLDGVLLRVGPNPVAVPEAEEDYHWFRGDGMVHAVSFDGSRPTGYRNRWVRTRALAAKAGTAPPRGPAEPVDGPANTHVVRFGGRTLALAESGFPHALPTDLTRARVYDFDGQLASPMTAHPKLDPATGELVFFGVDVFGPPFLRVHVADPSGQLVRTEAVEIPRATMMHDVGVTATRVVVLDLPIVFDLDLAAEGRALPYRWAPDAGARIGLMERRRHRPRIRWITMDPCYAFHVLNAYDDGDAIVVDVLRYERAFDTEPGGPISSCLPFLTRWTVDPGGNRVGEEVLDDAPVEYPRVADAVAGRPHRYGYATLLGPSPGEPSFGGLVKYDFGRDQTVRFDPGPGARRANRCSSPPPTAPARTRGGC